ncbi:lipopolysaccharide biosynthesis protein (plasmid) [Falsihalocynthiibacter sp. SS001]|uniref:lipopolysaccharide biosynthesis protein n=1 Tax=Falsihalocynthiibacter sp. SS001 TaxID=3349698 RepID=UPI0036D20D59
MIKSSFLRQSIIALVVKTSAAGLSFAMFLALARALPSDAFGQMGFAFSLATLLSVVGSFGQRALVLKYASIHTADGNNAALGGVLMFGYQRILLGGVALCLALAAWVLLTGSNARYLMWAGPLALALSLAEFQAHFLRAYDTMIAALVPRDIIWRLAVIASAGALIWTNSTDASAALALAIMTLSLLFIAAVQLAHQKTMRSLLRAPLPVPDSMARLWHRTSLGLWGVSMVKSAGPNLAVVMLGVILTPAETGPFFSALRVSMVLSLFLMAANMAGASGIARSFAQTDQSGLQHICTSAARAIALPTIAGFILIALLGKPVLRLFGEGFDAAYVPLLILSAGYLISALSGPTALVMETTGHERPYFRILTRITCLFLALMPLAIYVGGITGAAAMLAGNMIATQLLCYRYILRELHIAPGILSRRPHAAAYD